MNVVVTGGGGDTDDACARLLAARGDDVLVVDSDGAAAELLVSEINQRPERRALAQTADVARADGVRGYTATAVNAWRMIDGVVDAAGVAGPAAPLPGFDEAELDRVMAVNARGVFLGVKSPCRIAWRRGGGEYGERQRDHRVPAGGCLCGVEHAVIGLTRTAALEGAASGVRLNAVSPGRSRCVSSRPPEMDWRSRRPGTRSRPLFRLTDTAGRVAETVAFLPSEAAGYITGAALPVDGGLVVAPS